MTGHVGIVACSSEGAALCYRTVCAEASARLGGHQHPEISMHTPSLSDYVDCLEAGDLDGVADLMLASADKLAACGADFLVCPDNTIHQALGRVLPRSPLPWLHIAEELARVAEERGFTRLGLTGTRWLVSSDVYPRALEARGVNCIRPGASDRMLVDRIIMDELVLGQFNAASIDALAGVTRRLGDAGADAVVLGCTELPLVLDEARAGLPVLDSTRILAMAAVERALNG